MIRLEGPYRQSQINDYLSCPQALLLRLEGVEPLFRSLGQSRGSAVHGAIFQLHHDQAWDHWQMIFDDAWAEEFSRPGPPINATTDQIEKEYEDWRTAIENYVQREKDKLVLYSELPVRGVLKSLSGSEYTVEGIVDQIRISEDGTSYSIYEIKTNSSLPGPATLQRSIQLCLYCWCAVTGEAFVDGQWVSTQEALPGFLKNCVLYKLINLIPYKRSGKRTDGSKYQPGDLRGEPEITVPVEADQLVEGARGLARIIAAIRAGGFFWNPSAMYGGCDACPYKYACGTNRKGVPATSSKEVIKTV